MTIKTSKILISLIISIISFASISLANDYCGDGTINSENGEECDDGNFIERDGCSNYCKTEDMTPPEVTWVSIEEGTEGVSSIMDKITINFSEPINPETINENTVMLKQFTKILKTDYDLDDSKATLILIIEEDLIGEEEHAIVIKNIKDIAGNQISETFVRTFTAGKAIDHTPPIIKVKPEGGNYHVTQSVSLTPYIRENTLSDEYIDKEASIYYTTTGAIPTDKSDIYTTAISISKKTTLRYFGIDKKGNRSQITTQIYSFSCGDRPNATKIDNYPSCKVEECKYGFLLKSNVCVINLGADYEDDYKVNAATAPLFGSDTPMTISTKPALYITSEHKGIIPRPIHFKDITRGTIIDFERDTSIKTEDGRAFEGYIKLPINLYSKDFPINFGYTFKSIFGFRNVDNETKLYFDPPYKITIPFTERFEGGEEITIFTYDYKKEEYKQYPPSLVSVDEEEEEVSIIAYQTNDFFVAQEGKNYNKIIFKDCINHWARNYIEALYRKEIVKGRDKGIYAPDEYLTRAEFTKIALKAIEEEVDPTENVEKAPFYDVALYAWYVPYVKRAKEIGLINGYPDSSFKPDQPINKAEAIAILMRTFKFNLLSAGIRTDSYTDVLTNQWYFPAVNFAIQNRLIDGIRLPNGKIMEISFGPGRPITRAEMAKLAIKTIELYENSDE